MDALHFVRSTQRVAGKRQMEKILSGNDEENEKNALI
jgi:hypothetical protein